jgi:hypothetical protein
MRGLQMTGLPFGSVAVVFGLSCGAFSDSSGHPLLPPHCVQYFAGNVRFCRPFRKKTLAELTAPPRL